MLVLLRVALLILSLSAAAARLACEESGYCSIDAVQHFKGDIAGGQLRPALAQCSFKREVILLTATLDVLDHALQLHASLMRLGLAHQILLTPDEATCATSLGLFPRLCCVWSSLQLPERFFQHQLLLWNVRRSMAARSVRLGYNIMVIDTDVVIFDDPYKYLKSGPLKDIQLMTMGETWPYDSNSLLNLGWLYAQNVKPDGPVAAVLAEVPDRQLRYADDGGARLTALWGAEPNCGTDEQLLFDDAVYGAVLGRPVSVVSINMCGGATREQHAANYSLLTTAFGELASGSKQVFTKQTFPVPPGWQALVGGSTMMVKKAELHWTLSRGEWPIQYGGELLPAERGPLSSAFQALLRSDCPLETSEGCPIWPDPASDVDLKGESRSETYALAPPWLVASFSDRGVHGHWGQHPGVPVQQVVGHIHQTPCDGYVGKRGIMQYLGQYNWSLAHAVKGDGVFFASEKGRPVPQMVAMAPCVYLRRLVKNLEDFKAILRGMAAIAALLGDRAVLLPDLPCGLPFISEEGAAATAAVAARGAGAGGGGGGAGANGALFEVPLKLKHTYMSRGPLQGPGPQCTWQRFMIAGCVSKPLLGMLSWEFEHYQQLAQAEGVDIQPGPNNIMALMAGANGLSCPVPGNKRGGGGRASAGAEAGGGDGQGMRTRRRRRRRRMGGGEGGGWGGGGGEGGKAEGDGEQGLRQREEIDVDEDGVWGNKLQRRRLSSRRGLLQQRQEEQRKVGGEGAAATLLGSLLWGSRAGVREGEERGRGRREGSKAAAARRAGQQRRRRRLQGAGGAEGGGGDVATALGPHVWEADAGELLSAVLRRYAHERVVYLRRPVLVTWGHPLDGSPVAQAKLRYDQMLEGCFTLKPDPGEPAETLRRRKWSPALAQQAE